MIIGGIFSGIADWWSGLFGDGDADPKTVTKVLQDYGNYLQYQDVFSWICNTFLWGLIKGLYNLNTLLEKTIYQSFDLKDLLNAAGVNELFQSLISKVLALFCVVTLIYLGLKFFMSKHPPKIKNILVNLFMAMILIFGGSSLIDEGLNISKNFYGDVTAANKADKTGSPAFQIIQNNVIDVSTLLENDPNKVEHIPTDKRNALTAKNFKTANINGIITPDQAKKMSESSDISTVQKDRLKALQYRLELDDNGKEIPVQISDEGLAKYVYTSGYRRYISSPGIILAGESSLAVAYLFILFTIVTCIIELVFKKFYLVIAASTDFETGQRMKSAIEDISQSFLLLAFTILELRIYTLMLSGIGDLHAAGKINGFLYVVALIVLTIALFKGSQSVTKIFGVDTSLKNGSNSLLSMFALGNIAKNVGSGAKNLASAGKSGLSHLNDIRKNGFGHRKDVTPDNGEEQSDDKATTVPNSKKTVSEMFGKAKNGVSKAAEGLGYVNERGLKGTAEDLTEKAKDTLEDKLDGTRAKELAEAVKNPSEALEKQKEKASEVKEGLKDAYGEGQVNAAVKANTTTEKENQEGIVIPSVKDHQEALHSNENSIEEKNSIEERNSEEGKNGQLPKTDPEQYRYKPNSDLENEKRISDLSKVNQEDKAENEGQLPKTDPEQYRYRSVNSENEKRISDLPKRNQEVQTDEDSIVLPNDNGIEVGTEKSTKIGLPKAQNLPMKDSRLNQFKDNDQSFVHQSPAGTVQMKPSRLPENGNLTTVSYNLSESGETGNASVQNVVTREAAPKPIQNVHTGYKPANVAFTAPTKINVTRETKNRNNELKEQLLRDIKQDIKP
ncbi:pLS20_p028 family conjugation system transmembrane protein [Enterococcus faecium]|uniref:pLS20_p028 family conjugation system transmembrane protein n=3 Tax=Enterococcus faecium TaxID=1352 RepID=UPI0038F6B372